MAIEKNCTIEELPLDMLKTCSPLIEADIYECITPRSCVEMRNMPGGPAPERVREQIEQLKAFCKDGAL